MKRKKKNQINTPKIQMNKKRITNIKFVYDNYIYK